MVLLIYFAGPPPHIAGLALGGRSSEVWDFRYKASLKVKDCS